MCPRVTLLGVNNVVLLMCTVLLLFSAQFFNICLEAGKMDYHIWCSI